MSGKGADNEEADFSELLISNRLQQSGKSFGEDHKDNQSQGPSSAPKITKKNRTLWRLRGIRQSSLRSEVSQRGYIRIDLPLTLPRKEMGM